MTKEQLAMKPKNLFEGESNQLGETAVFTSLGLASVVMVLYALSSMVQLASGPDNFGGQIAAKSLPITVEAIATTTTTHRSFQSSVSVPRPGGRSLLTDFIPGREVFFTTVNAGRSRLTRP